MSDEKESNLVTFARHELKLIGGEDEMQVAINKHIIEMVELFSAEGHSGNTAPYTVNILKKLLMFQPLTPLTGEDNEWTELDHCGDVKYQNKRCSHVFKDADGKAYDIQAVVFCDKDGGHFTSSESRRYVQFPYVPKIEYQKVA